MSRRFMFTDPPPANAESYKDVRWHLYELAGKHYIKVWIGKAQKPTRHYSLGTRQRGEEYVKQLKRDADSREDYRAARKSARAESIAKTAEAIQVGTILHYSWGYEQTQCEFFQVVEKKNRSVVIREIGSRTAPDSTYDHGMADMRLPIRDKFIGPPIRKMIRDGGLSMSFGIATPTADDKAHYRSWYG